MEFGVKRADVIFMEGRHSEAVKIYRELAGDGDADAAFNYGFCCLFGLGCRRNLDEARSFFTFSMARVPEAEYNLAVMYMHGEGVPRDFSRAYDFMRDAAVHGMIEAQLYLGVAHTMGYMYEPDIIALSKIPFHTAIGRDPSTLIEGYVSDPDSEEEQRCCAVRQDPHSAFSWFREAAMHSPDYVEELSKKGKFLYARCFVDGLGTDFDRDRANRLMLVAARDGSEDALAYIETTAPYLLSALDSREEIEVYRKQERLGAPQG